MVFWGFGKFFYGGWKFKMLGAFPISSGEKNYNNALKTHVKILKDGGSMCIFPEGMFTRTGEMGEAHGGVVHLAKESNAKIAPVIIKGTYKLGIKNILARKTSVSIEFIKPVDVVSLFDGGIINPQDYKKIAEKLLDTIQYRLG